MTQLTFKVKGAKLVRKSLQDLGREVPRIGRLQIRRTLDRIVKIMRVYPPRPSGSTYIRTGRLGRSWKIETAGPSGYRIKNEARFRNRRYSKYVVGSASGEGQAWMHVGRWPLFRSVVDSEGAKLPSEIARHIKLHARKLRL